MGHPCVELRRESSTEGLESPETHLGMGIWLKGACGLEWAVEADMGTSPMVLQSVGRADCRIHQGGCCGQGSPG